MEILYFLGTLVFGYVMGSIPFGLLITKFAGLGDIRHVGSGNIGATNVLRTGRKGLALLTLVMDGGKGAFVVMCVSLLPGAGDVLPLLAGFCAIIGHCFPVWLKFKGGKGVATTLGTLLTALPLCGLLTCVTWLFVAVTFRISSLAALLAILLCPVGAYMIYGPVQAVICGGIMILVWVKHHANIKRILDGTEPVIGRKE